jgi:hypothetical protein
VFIRYCSNQSDPFILDQMAERKEKIDALFPSALPHVWGGAGALKHRARPRDVRGMPCWF